MKKYSFLASAFLILWFNAPCYFTSQKTDQQAPFIHQTDESPSVQDISTPLPSAIDTTDEASASKIKVLSSQGERLLKKIEDMLIHFEEQKKKLQNDYFALNKEADAFGHKSAIALGKAKKLYEQLSRDVVHNSEEEFRERLKKYQAESEDLAAEVSRIQAHERKINDEVGTLNEKLTVIHTELKKGRQLHEGFLKIDVMAAKSSLDRINDCWQRASEVQNFFERDFVPRFKVETNTLRKSLQKAQKRCAQLNKDHISLQTQSEFSNAESLKVEEQPQHVQGNDREGQENEDQQDKAPSNVQSPVDRPIDHVVTEKKKEARKPEKKSVLGFVKNAFSNIGYYVRKLFVWGLPDKKEVEAARAREKAEKELEKQAEAAREESREKVRQEREQQEQLEKEKAERLAADAPPAATKVPEKTRHDVKAESVSNDQKDLELAPAGEPSVEEAVVEDVSLDENNIGGSEDLLGEQTEVAEQEVQPTTEKTADDLASQEEVKKEEKKDVPPDAEQTGVTEDVQENTEKAAPVDAEEVEAKSSTDGASLPEKKTPKSSKNQQQKKKKETEKILPEEQSLESENVHNSLSDEQPEVKQTEHSSEPAHHEKEESPSSDGQHSDEEPVQERDSISEEKEPLLAPEENSSSSSELDTKSSSPEESDKNSSLSDEPSSEENASHNGPEGEENSKGSAEPEQEQPSQDQEKEA